MKQQRHLIHRREGLFLGIGLIAVLLMVSLFLQKPLKKQESEKSSNSHSQAVPTPKITVDDLLRLSSEDATKLSFSAGDTLEAFSKAGRPTDNLDSETIPMTFWTPEIQALHPKRVYPHNNNLIVVLEETNEEEKGIYIYNMLSSYFPFELMKENTPFPEQTQHWMLWKWSRKKQLTHPLQSDQRESFVN